MDIDICSNMEMYVLIGLRDSLPHKSLLNIYNSLSNILSPSYFFFFLTEVFF